MILFQMEKETIRTELAASEIRDRGSSFEMTKVNEGAISAEGRNTSVTSRNIIKRILGWGRYRNRPISGQTVVVRSGSRRCYELLSITK